MIKTSIICRAGAIKQKPCTWFEFSIKANSDGYRHNLTDISSPRGSHRAAPITCDAFNAQVVAGQEYHYRFHAVNTRKIALVCLIAVGVIAPLSS